MHWRLVRRGTHAYKMCSFPHQQKQVFCDFGPFRPFKGHPSVSNPALSRLVCKAMALKTIGAAQSCANKASPIAIPPPTTPGPPTLPLIVVPEKPASRPLVVGGCGVRGVCVPGRGCVARGGFGGGGGEGA